MTVHRFSTELWLPRPRTEVFPFFGDARNLQAITPDWLDFEVVTPGTITMRPGAIIEYRLKVRGLRLRWQTEITVWEPPERFVDVQRRGPYRQWIHQHTFAEQNGGTLCGDQVDYAVPGGRLVNWLWVRHDVRRIFQFRQRKLQALFPPANAT